MKRIIHHDLNGQYNLPYSNTLRKVTTIHGEKQNSASIFGKISQQTRHKKESLHPNKEHL